MARPCLTGLCRSHHRVAALLYLFAGLRPSFCRYVQAGRRRHLEGSQEHGGELACPGQLSRAPTEQGAHQSGYPRLRLDETSFFDTLQSSEPPRVAVGLEGDHRPESEFANEVERSGPLFGR